MTDRSRNALLALEGPDRSDKALCALRDYVAELISRVGDELPIANFYLECELVALLRKVEASVDPTGDSAYRMQIVPRRDGAGRPPNPRAKERRLNMAVMAAVTSDKLMAANPEMQKKEANSRAAHTWGVTVSEIYGARKEPAYDQLREQPEKR